MSDEDSRREHVEEFSLRRPLYEALSSRLSGLLTSLLEEAMINYHMIEARAKSVESFREKISRPGKGYKSPVAEMPDLCGVRVITYYQDDCERVGDLIKREFKVLEEELAHHPSQLEADRFGYLSSHYVISLNRNRARLGEWKPFNGLRAEIQIRTVIQHAWSAVSHAVQYKEESQIPSRLQRRLYRIAGLFELADEEFIGIRDQRTRLREEAAAALASGNQQLKLSSASLMSFVATWDNLPKAREQIVSAGFTATASDEEDVEIIGDIYELASGNGVRTIEQLSKVISNPDLNFLKRLREQIPSTEKWSASPAFMVNLLLISRFIEKITFEYLVGKGWDTEYARRIMQAAKT